MATYNRTILAGNLVADPELNMTNNQIPVLNVTIAVNDPRSKQEDNAVDYIDLVIWRELAETVANYKVKGDPILIEGKLKQNTWKDKDTGANRSKVVVVVDQVQFLSRGTGSSTRTQTEEDNPFDGDEDIPF